MKKKTLVIWIIGMCFTFLIGCSTSQMIAGGIETMSVIATIANSDNKTDSIRKYKIGENTVQLDTTVYQGRPGYLFTAFDSNNQELGKKFYPAGDEQGMKRYKPFKKMGTEEKKQFIHEDFLALGIDLDPEIEIAASPTPPAPASVSHIPISGFAPASY